ncbi:MAG: hypothetical protein WC979_02760 [Candidatus Pacearchaeota archaeon]|jgi:hypothetical protein|nr:hypothetical protein [Clostridia bacterium]
MDFDKELKAIMKMIEMSKETKGADWKHNKKEIQNRIIELVECYAETSLQGTGVYLRQSLNPDFVAICDGIEKALKKGKDDRKKI